MERKLTPYLIFILPVLAVATALFVVPVSYDEAWTFLNFTQKGMAFSASHYPAPNNHVLHSLLTVVTDALPGGKHLWKIRLMPFVWYGAGLFATFRIVGKHFGLPAAIVVTAIGSSLFMSVYYGYMSRGYGLVYLMFVLGFGESLSLVKKEVRETRHFVLLSLFSVIGFYAIPSFVYPYLTLQVFIFLLRPALWWKQAAWGSLTAGCVASAYLPIILTEGIDAIIANPFVEPIGFMETLRRLPGFLLALPEEISGITKWFWAAIFTFSLWEIIRTKNRLLLALVVSVFGTAAILMLAQRAIPFPRTFHYTAFAMVLLFAVAIGDRFRKPDPARLFVGGVVLQALLLGWFAFRIGPYEDRDLALNTTASKIIPEIAGDKRYFFVGTLLPTNLEFELIERGYKNYHIEFGFTQDAETIKGFDYVIIDRQQDKSNVTPLYRHAYYSVYRK